MHARTPPALDVHVVSRMFVMPLFSAEERGHAEEGLRVAAAQGVDLAAWLREHVGPGDHVTVVADVGGREGALLRHLLRAGALPLIDRLLVHWHPQHLVPLP